jgi:rhodanese-related sulfurtransferase
MKTLPGTPRNRTPAVWCYGAPAPSSASQTRLVMAGDPGYHATKMSGNRTATGSVFTQMVGTVWRALVLALVGVLTGFAANALRSDGVAIADFAPPVTCTDGAHGLAAMDTPPVRLVRQSEATVMCAEGSTVIADARDAKEFASGHIAGAIHLPCSASEKVALAAESGLSGKKLLLVYGESTDDAFPVAEQMRQRLGRSDLHIGVLEGGFAAWSSAGLACSSGICPECGAEEHGGHTP